MRDQQPVHPRRLELERLAMNEPSASSAHVASCTQCASTLEELRKEARAFAARVPASAFLEQLAERRRPWWQRFWPVFGLVPIAAALALVFADRQIEPDVRFKGTGLQIFVTRDGEQRALNEQPRAGDRLTFVYEARRDGHLLLLDVERGKAPTAFFPFGGERSGTVTAGRNALRDGVMLDDTQADEWLVAVFSPKPLRVEEVAAAIGEGLIPSNVEGPSFSCEGCEVEVRRLTRVRP